MSKIVVFDLDGTLALDEHRAHHLRANPKDWASYFAACPLDTPNLGVVLAFQALSRSRSVSVQIWTARNAQYADATLEWCLEHLGRLPNELLMRGIEDRTDDNELKRQWLNTARARGNEVVLVFEDRKRVVEMWRAEGIICAQVAPGEF